MSENGGYGVDGRNIRQLRIGKRWTQQVLANRADLSLTQVSRIEGNKQRPRFSTLERLAAALEVDPDDLIDLAS